MLHAPTVLKSDRSVCNSHATHCYILVLALVVIQTPVKMVAPVPQMALVVAIVIVIFPTPALIVKPGMMVCTTLIVYSTPFCDLNFGKIPSLTLELAAPERLKNQ